MADQVLFTLEAVTETRQDTVLVFTETVQTSVAAGETTHTVESILPSGT